jgi:chemotaxis signal transduction protein
VSRAGAWLLTLGTHRAAVGVREQVHLMLEPGAAELAGTPAHCRHVIFWNGRCVPVMDLSRWLDPSAESAGLDQNRHLGVYAYQQGADAPVEFGALWLARPPQRIDVDDAAAAPLPEDCAGWARVAVACFADAAGAVPILDLPRIFSGALAD